MGCCSSSPHNKRIYRDPGDMDEEVVPVRTFGQFRAGSNLIPDDIGGLPSPHLQEYLASHADEILYEAEVDHGYAFRCYRLIYGCLFTPWGLVYSMSKGINKICSSCPCDEGCCWVRKEYSTRSRFLVYPNRIVSNKPRIRFPFGYLGCGSWNADDVVTHVFDRGAFGFQRVACGTVDNLCCIWPVYGGSVARHRCNCNGPVWNRCCTDCGGCWCDEWLCTMFFCVYTYDGLANADEAAFACSIALQAYFEGRCLRKSDMDKCIEFWRNYISEEHDPLRKKRPVCCEPYYVPINDCSRCYRAVHPRREIPFPEEEQSAQIKKIYARYEVERSRQIARYENVYGPLKNSTLCRTMGCRRLCGRKGFFFCTEGCDNFDRKKGDPAPPLSVHDFDDDFDASTVLMKVLGPPPPNVVIKRWRWDPNQGKNVLEVYPEGALDTVEEGALTKPLIT